ncbi:hypothetical protein CONPUDRAFT_68594 [Coniophora puteana RWD-64-598 SS2]|uniref:Methyltransferase domain-containing protein n=1 Tax=Coniophora puteana (strain RWD-64-598) TaxID=741705 RepID=A0A5M3N3G7_CONPW|nr:uncharacterized protein CONPUDRAFT_68594 [Coniophora puteana RWD-64-598 SS2]EIW85952.1 hypothetical protein CONPUDRAFT_68594 [Coniophora puteana RWD-64-598 SS2]
MAPMGLAHRHPRFTASLGVLFLVALIFFFATDSGDAPGYVRFKSGTDLALELWGEERRYRDMLKGRKGLIRTWGPSPDKVVATPDVKPKFRASFRFPVKPKEDFYTLWDFFPPSFKCPHNLERIGVMGDGGKWTCGLERIEKKEKCVIYTFGINGESSFEAGVMKRAKGCDVWGYDFSVNSFGPEIEKDEILRSRSHFFSYALGPKDAPYADPPTYTLQTLMKRNGHSFIDILKIDIEGNEYDSLISFFDSISTNSPLPIGQVQMEVHVYQDSEWNYFPKFLAFWEKLEKRGLRPFFSEPNMVYANLIRDLQPGLAEYSFINVKGDHELVNELTPERPRGYPPPRSAKSLAST